MSKTRRNKYYNMNIFFLEIIIYHEIPFSRKYDFRYLYLHGDVNSNNLNEKDLSVANFKFRIVNIFKYIWDSR